MCPPSTDGLLGPVCALEAELPGVKAEDVDVELNDNLIRSRMASSRDSFDGYITSLDNLDGCARP